MRCAPRQRRLPARRHVSRTAAGHQRDIAEALAGHRIHRVARAVARHARDPAAGRRHVEAGRDVVSATKGLEQETLFRVSEIVEQELGRGVRVAVLSGPSFASEMARELPTAVSVASRDARSCERCRTEFRAPYFRLYGTQRRGRRRDRRRAEERHRHCGRGRRRAGPRAQRAGGAHHARAGRDCRGWPAPRARSAKRWPG